MIVKWKQTWNTLRVEHTGSGELSGEPMLLNSLWEDISLALLSSKVCHDVGRRFYSHLITEDLRGSPGC